MADIFTSQVRAVQLPDTHLRTQLRGVIVSYHCDLQTGKGFLAPNDAFTMPSVVKYGKSASDLSMTATGTAQASNCSP